MSLAQPAHQTAPETREQRALQLYRERGGEIRHMYGATYRVPSQDGERAYEVEYGRREYCSCPDHLYRNATCIHLYALAVAIAKGRFVHPELAAGDPFVAAGQDHPHACNAGWVTLGYTDEDGNERHEVLPCRRCGAGAGS